MLIDLFRGQFIVYLTELQSSSRRSNWRVLTRSEGFLLSLYHKVILQESNPQPPVTLSLLIFQLFHCELIYYLVDDVWKETVFKWQSETRRTESSLTLICLKGVVSIKFDVLYVIDPTELYRSLTDKAKTRLRTWKQNVLHKWLDWLID